LNQHINNNIAFVFPLKANHCQIFFCNHLKQKMLFFATGVENKLSKHLWISKFIIVLPVWGTGSSCWTTEALLEQVIIKKNGGIVNLKNTWVWFGRWKDSVLWMHIFSTFFFNHHPVQKISLAWGNSYFCKKEWRDSVIFINRKEWNHFSSRTISWLMNA